MDNLNIEETKVDESIKEIRLPVIEQAVMTVQGYTEPQISISGQIEKLMEGFDSE